MRREIFRIPHMQASEVRAVDVPTGRGVAAHRNFLVTTACGEDKPTTLVTRNRDKVRCPECRTALGITS